MYIAWANIARPYFDLCDGIFLNYNWTEAGLASSAALAKERNGEVYVGIDVFGRGCPGGGGYNSCKVYNIGQVFGQMSQVAWGRAS